NRGQAREEAYRLVQRLAHEADRPGGDFRARCLASPELTQLISPAEIEEALALDRYLGGIEESLQRLGLVPEPTADRERGQAAERS
ncbi:protein containing Adenylosuccinate lyase, partial [mine drainage metagenome]